METGYAAPQAAETRADLRTSGNEKGSRRRRIKVRGHRAAELTGQVDPGNLGPGPRKRLITRAGGGHHPRRDAVDSWRVRSSRHGHRGEAAAGKGRREARKLRSTTRSGVSSPEVVTVLLSWMRRRKFEEPDFSA